MTLNWIGLLTCALICFAWAWKVRRTWTKRRRTAIARLLPAEHPLPAHPLHQPALQQTTFAESGLRPPAHFARQKFLGIIPPCPTPEMYAGALLFQRYQVPGDLPVIRSNMAAIVYAEDTTTQEGVVLKFQRTQMDQESPDAVMAETFCLANGRTFTPRLMGAYLIEDTYPCIVMERLPGEDLGKLCHKEALDPTTQLAIATRLLLGVEYFHQLGVFLRDIKPTNVIVHGVVGGRAQTNLTVHLIDFNLAVRLHEKEGSGYKVHGTPAYTAPEGCELVHVPDPFPCDQFSLGATLFEMMTGDWITLAEDACTALAEISSGAYLKRLRIPPTRPIHQELFRIVLRMLSYNPQHRFRSIADARAAVEALPY